MDILPGSVKEKPVRRDWTNRERLVYEVRLARKKSPTRAVISRRSSWHVTRSMSAWRNWTASVIAARRPSRPRSRKPRPPRP